MSNWNLKTENRFFYTHHDMISNSFITTKLDEILIQLLAKILLKIICDDESLNLGACSLKDDQRTKFHFYKKTSPILSYVNGVP